MPDTTLLTVIIALTALAVLLQAAVLFAIFQTLKKTAAKVDAAMEVVRENREKITAIVSDSAVTARNVRETVVEARPQVTELLTFAKEKVERADEMVTRTMDRVEQTTDTITAPVRRVNGVVRAIGAMFESVVRPPRR